MKLELSIGFYFIFLSAFCSTSSELLEQLNLPFLSELRFKFRQEPSKTLQCALYWNALNSKMGLPIKYDDRPLIERVDINLLIELADTIKGRSKSLSEYLEDCVSVIKLSQHSRFTGAETLNSINDEDDNDNNNNEVNRKEINEAESLPPVPDSSNLNRTKFEQQIAALEAEKAILKQELDAKTKQLHFDSVMHQADMVALGVKKKNSQKELLKRNKDLETELNSLKQQVVTLEDEKSKVLKDQSEREEALRKRALNAELDLANKRGNDCSTKARELELINQIGECEKNLKTEKDRSNSLQADISNLNNELSDNEDRLKYVKARVDANKNELINSRQDLELERNEVAKLKDESTRCKSQLNNFLMKVRQLENTIKDLEVRLDQSRVAAKENLNLYEKSREDWRKEKAAKEEALLKLDMFGNPCQNFGRPCFVIHG